jgi:hypothetical protein
MERSQQLEVLRGEGRVRLADRYVPVRYEIRRFQYFDDDVPTITGAQGVATGLSRGDLGLAMGKVIELELDDRRKAQIIVESDDGGFKVTGPIA